MALSCLEPDCFAEAQKHSNFCAYHWERTLLGLRSQHRPSPMTFRRAASGLILLVAFVFIILSVLVFIFKLGEMDVRDGKTAHHTVVSVDGHSCYGGRHASWNVLHR